MSAVPLERQRHIFGNTPRLGLSCDTQLFLTESNPFHRKGSLKSKGFAKRPIHFPSLGTTQRCSL